MKLTPEQLDAIRTAAYQLSSWIENGNIYVSADVMYDTIVEELENVPEQGHR